MAHKQLRNLAITASFTKRLPSLHLLEQLGGFCICWTQVVTNTTDRIVHIKIVFSFLVIG
ncbi:hypothetical protein Lalb_Chr18g0057191 [Lupinus albus]|uniref:Uncharacterized protein n=1 Tax=Lupinus albus TaxID=3870 RepID=A0A6A4P034_LUPAL|nr:hypothetical protein Lalb_Chr18g0057191 [Lupinus albus]